MTKRNVQKHRGRPRMSASDRTVMLAVHIPVAMKKVIEREAASCDLSSSSFARYSLSMFLEERGVWSEWPTAKRSAPKARKGAAR